MSFTQIVYASQASDSLVEADIVDILRKSQVRNNQSKVSGILLFRDRRFLQFLEGPAAEVEALYERIARDPRHHALEVLTRAQGEQLLMPTWAMAYTSPTLDPIAREEAFMLGRQQAQTICELLPEHIACHFIELLAAERTAT